MYPLRRTRASAYAVVLAIFLGLVLLGAPSPAAAYAGCEAERAGDTVNSNGGTGPIDTPARTSWKCAPTTTAAVYASR